MANRAYLFISNSAQDWEYSNRQYFDSRHNIPLAWWFLFREENVFLVDVESYDGKEVRFSANKTSAPATLANHKDLLSQIVGAKLDPELLEWFIGNISDWPEEFLLMNPWEVLQGEEHDYEPCLQIARRIHAAPPDIDRIIEAVSLYSQVDYSQSDAEEIIINVIGYTYW